MRLDPNFSTKQGHSAAHDEMLSGSYQERALYLAAKAPVRDIIWSNCGCLTMPRRCLMFDPEDFKDLRKAAERYFWHRLLRTRYWGVHVKGKHLLHIHCEELAWNQDDCCRECRRRRFGPDAT